MVWLLAVANSVARRRRISSQRASFCVDDLYPGVQPRSLTTAMVRLFDNPFVLLLLLLFSSVSQTDGKSSKHP